MKLRILLADDDRYIRSGFKAVLESEGYEVIVARDGVEAINRFVLEGADAVLLDLMMPKKNGFVVCEEIRAQNSTVPILFLTGNDNDASQLRGFGLGADDFITKDSGKEIILARLKRALTRTKPVLAPQKTNGLICFELGRLSVNLNLGVLKSVRGHETRLTRTEAQILKALASSPGTTQTVPELIAKIRGNGFVCDESMLYVHMSHLRSKLGSEAERLFTVRGIGYGLAISGLNTK